MRKVLSLFFTIIFSMSLFAFEQYQGDIDHTGEDVATVSAETVPTVNKVVWRIPTGGALTHAPATVKNTALANFAYKTSARSLAGSNILHFANTDVFKTGDKLTVFLSEDYIVQSVSGGSVRLTSVLSADVPENTDIIKNETDESGITNLSVIGSSDGYLYGYSPASGKVYWRNSVTSRLGSLFSSPAIDNVNKIIYALSNTGRLFAFNYSGEFKFAYPPLSQHNDAAPVAGPVIKNSICYIAFSSFTKPGTGFEGARVVGINASGHETAVFSVPNNETPTHMVVSSSIPYVILATYDTDGNGKIYALDAQPALLTESWSYSDLTMKKVAHQPLIKGDDIIVTDIENKIFSISSTTPPTTPKWTATPSGDILNVGVIDDDKVILPYKDRFVFLELSGGLATDALFSNEIIGAMPNIIDITSPLAFSDGKFIFSDKDGVVYQATLDYSSSVFTQIFDCFPALSSGLGYSLPIIAAAGVADGSPDIAGGVMMIASTDGYIYGIGDGTEITTPPADPPVVSNIDGEWSTFGSDKGRTNSLTEDDKILSGPLQPSLRWFDDLRESISSAAVISYHTSNSQPIVIVAVDGRIHAYDASTGAKKWQYPPVGTDKLAQISSSPAINSDGDVVFSTVTGTVYVLATTDVSATLKRADTLNTPVSGSPVIGKGGHIYVLTSGKYINPIGSQSTNYNIYTYTLANNTSINGLTFKTTNTAGTLYFYDNTLADSDPIFLKEYTLTGSDGTVSLAAKLNNIKRIVWQVAVGGNPNVSNLELNVTSDISSLSAGITYTDHSSATPISVNHNNIDDYRGHELHASFAEQNIFSIMMSSLNDYTIKVVGADNILYTVGNFAGSNVPREIFIDKVIKSICWVKNDIKITSITEFSLTSRDTTNASAYMHVFDGTGEIYQYPDTPTTFLSPVNSTPAIATAADGKDILVFTTFDGKMYAVESDIAGTQGNLLANYPLNLYANIVASPTITNIGGEAYVFVVAVDGTCYLVNLATSEIASRFKLSQSAGSFTNTPSIGIGNIAYVVSTGGHIFKVNLRSLVPVLQSKIVSAGDPYLSPYVNDAAQVVVSGILINTHATNPAKMDINDSLGNPLMTIEYDATSGDLNVKDNLNYTYGTVNVENKDGLDILFIANTLTGRMQAYYRQAYNLSNYVELPLVGLYNLPNDGIQLGAIDGEIHNAKIYYFSDADNDDLIRTSLGISSIASVPTEVNSTPLLDSGGRLYFGGVRGALYCFDGKEIVYSFMPRRPIISTTTLERVLSAASPATFKVSGASGFRVGDPVGIMNADGSLLEDLGVVTGMVIPNNTTSTTVIKRLTAAALKDAEPEIVAGELVFNVASATNIIVGDGISILPAYNGKGYISLGTVTSVVGNTIGVGIGTHTRITGNATNITHVDGETTMKLTFTPIPAGIEAGLLCYRGSDISSDTPYYQVRSVSGNDVTISFYSTDASVSNPVYPPAGTDTWYFISFPTGSEFVVGDTTTYIQVSNPPKYTREAGETLFVQNYTAAMPLSSPVSLGTGQIVYIGGDDGVLYAIGPIGPAGLPSELPPLPEVAKIDLWNTFHADFQRTGYFGNPAPRTESLRWYRNTASKLYSSPALGFNDSTAPLGVLYQGTVDSGITSKGSLIAYNANNGGIRWRFTDQNRMGAVYSSPTVFRDERMYHFGGTYETEAIVFGTVEGSNSAYAGLTTQINMGATATSIYVNNASSFTVGMSVSIAPLGATDMSNNDFIGVVKSVDTTTDTIELATKYVAQRTYLQGSQVVGMTSQQGRLYSVDRLGRLNWVFPNRTAVGDDIIAPIYSSPAVDSKGVTYFVTEDAVVYAIDLYGNVLFREVLELPSGGLGTPDITSAPALNLSESMLIVSAGLLGENKGILYAIDIVTSNTDERVIWANDKDFKTGIFTASPMIMSANGQEIIIIGTENEDDIYGGALYSVNLEDGSVISVDAGSQSIGATAAAIPDNTSVSTRARKTSDNTISVDRISGIEVGTRLRLVYIGHAPEIKEVAAINANTITFNTDLSTDSSTNMTVYTLDRIILVPTMTGRVNAYYVNDSGEFADNNNDPLPLWSFTVSNRSIVSSPAIAKFTTSTDVHPTYTVLVGSNDHNMTAFNLKGMASSPVLLWKKNLRDRQLASPVVGPKTADNGRAIIYQASMDGYVYAFGDQINLDTDDPTNPPQDPSGPDDEYTPPSEWGDDRVPSRLTITKSIDRLMDRDFVPMPPPNTAIKANTIDTFVDDGDDTSNWWRVTVVARNVGEGIIDNVKITDIIPLDLASLVEIYFADDESALGIATRRIKTSANQSEGIKLISFGEYTGTVDATYKITTDTFQHFVVEISDGVSPVVPSLPIPIGPGPIALGTDGIVIAFTKPAAAYIAGETYEFDVYEQHGGSPIHKDNRESWEIVWDNFGEGYVFYGNVNNQTAGIIATVTPNGVTNTNLIPVSDTSKFTENMEIEFSPNFDRAVVAIGGINATQSTITISKNVSVGVGTVIRAVPEDRKSLATTMTNVTNSTILEVDDKTKLKNHMDIVFISNGRKINAKIREVSPSTNEIMFTAPVSLLAGTLITLAPPPSSRTFTFYVRVKDIEDPYEDTGIDPEARPIIKIKPGDEEVTVGSNVEFRVENAPAVSDELQGSNQLTAIGNTYNGGESLPINENSQVPMYNGWSDDFISRLYYNGMIAGDILSGVPQIPANKNDYMLALVGVYDKNLRKTVSFFQTGNIETASWIKVFHDLNQVDMANGQPLYFTLPYNITGGENKITATISDYTLSMALNINAQAATTVINVRNNATGNTAMNRNMVVLRAPRNYGAIPYGYRLTSQQSKARIGRRNVWGRELPVETIKHVSGTDYLTRYNEWEKDITVVNPIVLLNADGSFNTDSGKFDFGLADPRNIKILPFTVENRSNNNMSPWNLNFRLMFDDVFLRGSAPSAESTILEERFGMNDGRGAFWQGLRYDPFESTSVRFARFNASQRRGLSLWSDAILTIDWALPIASYHPQGTFSTQKYTTTEAGLKFDNGRWYIPAPTNDGTYKHGRDTAVSPSSMASMRVFWDLNGDGAWQVGEPYYIKEGENIIAQMKTDVAEVKPLDPSNEHVTIVRNHGINLTGPAYYSAKFARILFGNEGTRSIEFDTALIGAQETVKAIDNVLGGSAKELNIYGLLNSRMQPVITNDGNTNNLILNKRNELQWVPFNYNISDLVFFATPVGHEVSPDITVDIPTFLSYRQPKGYYSGSLYTYLSGTAGGTTYTFNEIEITHKITASIVESRESFSIPEEYQYDETNTLLPNMTKTAVDGKVFNWVNYLNGNERDPVGVVIPDSGGTLGIFVVSNTDEAGVKTTTDSNIWYRQMKRERSYGTVKFVSLNNTDPLVPYVDAIELELPMGVANKIRTMQYVEGISGASTDTVDLLILVKNDGKTTKPVYAYPSSVDLAKGIVRAIPFTKEEFDIDETYTLEIVSHPYINISDKLDIPMLGSAFVSVNNSAPSVVVTADDKLRLSWTISGIYLDESGQRHNFSYLATRMFDPNDPSDTSTFEWIIPKSGGKGQALTTRQYVQTIPLYGMAVYEGVIENRHGLYFADIPEKVGANYRISSIDSPLSAINYAFLNVGRPQLWMDTQNGNENNAVGSKVNMIFQAESTDGNTDLYYARLMVNNANHTISVDTIGNADITVNMPRIANSRQYNSSHIAWSLTNLRMYLSINDVENPTNIWTNPTAVTETEFEVSATIGGVEYRVLFNPYLGVATVRAGNDAITNIKIIGQQYLQRLTENLAQDIAPVVVVERWQTVSVDGARDYGFAPTLENNPRIWVYWMRRHTDNLGVRAYYQSFRQMGGSGKLSDELSYIDNYRGGEKILPLQFLTQDSRLMAVRQAPVHFMAPVHLATATSATGFDVTVTLRHPIEPGVNIWLKSSTGITRSTVMAVNGNVITLDIPVDLNGGNVEVHLAEDGFEAGTWLGTVVPRPLRRPIRSVPYTLPSANDLFLQVFNENVPIIN